VNLRAILGGIGAAWLLSQASVAAGSALVPPPASTCLEWRLAPELPKAGAPKAVVGIADLGNLTVIDLEGDYARGTALPRQEIARAFLQGRGDDYEFLVVFTTFEYDTGDALAFYNPLRNDVRGIGLPVFDNGSAYGSAARLAGIVDMAAVSRHAFDPGDPRHPQLLNTLAHELMHRWAVGVRFRTPVGVDSTDLIGRDGSHWSNFVDSDGSVLYGNDWQALPGGRFRSVRVRHGYSPLDLYLGGFLAAGEVPPTTLLRGAAGDAAGLPQLGAEIGATAESVAIEQIMSAEGARSPSAADAPKSFRAGLLLLKRPGEAVPAQLLAQLERLRVSFQQRFTAMTGGRGTLRFGNLPRRAATPGLPGIVQPSAPRGSDAQVQDGLAWLRARQQPDGRFEDDPGTVLRDTAYAVMALSELSPGDPAIARARAFLASAPAVTLEDHAWRAAGLPSDRALSIDAIEGLQAGDTFRLAPGLEGGLFDTQVAVDLLGREDPTPARWQAYVARTEAWQGSDGAFGVHPGGGASLRTTALAIANLAFVDPTGTRSVAVRDRARSWLLARQAADGGFGESMSESLEVFARQPSIGLPEAPYARLRGWVRGRQGTSGDFGGSVFATSLALLALTRDGAPNLAIAGPIRFDPTSPLEGTIVRVVATIENRGGGAAVASTVRFHDGAPSAGGPPIGVPINVLALVPGGRSTAVALFDTRGRAGARSIHVVVDAANDVAESSESDNESSAELIVAPAPAGVELLLSDSELTITPPRIVSAPVEVVVTGTLRNLGATPAANVLLRASLDRASAPPLAEGRVDVPALGNAPFTLRFMRETTGAFRLGVAADADAQFAEADEANNTVLRDVPAGQGIDLSLAADGLSLVGGATPVAGRPLRLRVAVDNRGASDAPQALLEVGVTVGGDRTVLPTQPIQVAGGGRVTREFDWTPRTTGPIRFDVTVDPANAVAELDEDNNRAALDVTVAADSGINLAIDDALLDLDPAVPRESAPLRAQVRVRNVGAEAAPPTVAALYAGDPRLAGREIARVAVPGIAAGAVLPLEIAVASLAVRGDTTFYVVVDAESAVAETDEVDNFALRNVPVLALADLSIALADIQLDPSRPVSGEPVSATARIRNLGQQPAAGFTVRLSEIGADVAAVPPDRVVDGLAPGATAELAWTWTLGRTPDPRALRLEIDPAGNLAEIREDNNRLELPLDLQDGTVFASQRWFSPNGDGVKDLVRVAWRLPVAEPVRVEVRNAGGRVVRRFAVQDLARGETTWDGRNDRGRVVPDGDYRIDVRGAAGRTIGTLDATVDTNRSTAVEAIDTPRSRLVSLPATIPPNGAGWRFPPRGGATRFAVFARAARPPSGVSPPRFVGLYRSDTLFPALQPVLSQEWLQRYTTANGDYAGEILDFWFMPDGERILFLLRTEVSFGPYRYVFGTTRPDAVDNPTLLGSLQTFPGGRTPFVEGVLDANTALLRWPQASGFERRLLDVRSGASSPFATDVPPDAAVAAAFAQGVVFRSDGFDGAQWVYAPRQGGAARALGSWRGALLSPDRRALAGIREDGATQSVWLVGLDGTPPRQLAAVARAPFVFAPDDLRYPDQLTMAWVARAGELMVVDAAAPAMSFFSSAAEPLGSIPLPVRHDPLEPLEQGALWIASANGVHLGRTSFPTQERCDGSTTWLAERPMHQWFDAANESLSVAIARTIAIRRTETESGELVPEVREAGLSRYDVDLFGGVAGAGGEDAPAWMFGDGSRIGCRQDLWSAGGVRLREQWDLTPAVLDVSPDEDALLLTAAPGPAGTASGGRVLGSFLNLPTMLRAENIGRAIRLYGLVADRQFDRWELEWAPAGASPQWQSVTSPSSTEVLADDFIYWTPPEPGTYLVRLRAFDRAGNTASSVVQVVSQFTADVGRVSASQRAISPNGDGVQDEVRLDYEVRRATTLRIEVRDGSGVVQRSVVRTVGEGELGPAWWTWDARSDGSAVVPEGRYTLWINEQRLPVLVDTRAPTGEPRLLPPFEASKGRAAMLQLSPPGRPMVQDANLAAMALEYQDGSGWRTLREIPVGNPTLDVVHEDYAGRTLRLRAVDLAGNRTLFPLGEAVEQLSLVERTALSRAAAGASRPRLERFDLGSNAPPFTSPPAIGTRALLPERFDLDLLAISTTAQGLVEIEYQTAMLSNDPAWQVRARIAMDAVGTTTCARAAIAADACPLTGPAAHWQYVDALLDPLALAESRPSLVRVVGRRSDGSQLASNWIRFDPDALGFELACANGAQASGSLVPPSVRAALLRDAGIPRDDVTAAMYFAGFGLLPPDGLRSLDRIDIGTVVGAATVLAQEAGGALILLSPAAQAEVASATAAQGKAVAIARLTTQVDGARAVAGEAPRCAASPIASSTGLRATVEPLLGAECSATPSNAVRLKVGTDAQGTATLRRVVVVARDPATGIESPLLDRAFAPAISVGPVGDNPWTLDADTSALPAGAAEVLVRVDRGQGLQSLEPAAFVVDRTVGNAAIFEPAAGSRICATRPAPLAAMRIPITGAVDGGDPGITWHRLGVGEGAAPLAWREDDAASPGPRNGPLGRVPVEQNGGADPFSINGQATVRVRAWDWSGAQVCARQTVEIDSRVDAREDPDGALGPILGTTVFGPVLGLSGRGRFQRIGLPYRIGERIDFRLTLHALAQPDEPASALVDAPLATVQEGFAQAPVLRVEWDGVLGGQPVAEGVHGLRLELVDACGFSRRFEYRLRVDRTPPAVALTQPVAAATVAGLQVEVRGTVDDPRLARWQVLAGSAAPGSVLATVGEGTSPVPTAARLAAWNRGSLSGAATIALLAEDTLDNLARVDVPIVLDAPSSLLAGATVSPPDFSPNGDGVRDSSRLEVVLARAARATLRVLDEDGALQRVLASDISIPAGATAWSWDGRGTGTVPVADGSYRLELRLTDAAQPAASETHPFAVNVDTTPPVLSPLPDDAEVVPAGRAIGARIADERVEGYQVALRRDGDSVEVARTAGTDAAEVVLSSSDALDEAAYRLAGSATDRAGNAARLDHRLVVDRTPPTADLVAPIDGAVLRRGAIVDVSGSIGDAHLDRWELRLARSGAPPVPLASGTAPVAAGSVVHAWSVQQAEGDVRLQLSATDLAGNATTVVRPLAIDATPPVAIITAPAKGAAFRDELRIEGTASDRHFRRYRIALAPAAGPAAGQFSELFEGESAVAAGPLFHATLARPEGDYLLRLTVEDQAGHTSSATVSVRIDAQPPPVPSGLVATPVENRDVALDWADVAASDLAGYRVYRNGVALATEPSQSALRDALAPEGRLRYAVSAVDRAGNESARSAPAEVALDRTPPRVALAQPLEGEAVAGVVEVRGSVLSDGDLSAWGLLRTAESGGAPERLAEGAQERDDAVLVAWDTRALADQTAHRLTLQAADRAGNQATAEVRVVVDNGPPAPPQGLVANVNGSDIALDWQPNAEGDLLGYLVYRDGVLLTVSGAPPLDLRPYAIDADEWLDEDVGDGTRRYRVRAIDRAGNTSEPSAEAAVELDTSPPRLTLVEPADGQQFDRSIRLRAQSQDVDIAQVEFAWRAPGGAWNVIGAPLASPPWTVEWTPEGLAFGPYELRALARDAAGRVDPQPPAVTVRFADLTPPDPPGDVRARADGLRVRTTWQASAANDVALYRVYRGSGIGAAPLAELPATARDHESDAQGTWDVLRTVVAVDAEGNVSAVAPAGVARIFTPQWDEPFTPVAAPTVRLTGRSVAGGSARLTVVSATGTTETGPVTADAEGRFEFDAAALGAGENRLEVRVSDADGNRSLPAETFIDRAIVPGTPSDVVVALATRTATVGWTPRPGGEAIGYRVFRNGSPLLGDADTPLLSASSPHLPLVSRTIDNDPGTSIDVPPGFDGRLEAPLVIELRAPAVENLVGLRLLSDDATRRVVDATVEAWSGRRWVRVGAFAGNADAERFVLFEIVYRTQRVRLLLHRVPPLVGATIAELDLVRRPLFVAPPVERLLADGRHVFRVSAVERHAFEGVGADAAPVEVGDAEAPEPVVLSGAVTGNDAVLEWTASTSPDVAAYVLRRDGRDLVRLPADGTRRHVDAGRPNGQYEYVVLAVDAFDNMSAPSNLVRVAIDAGLPGPPQWVSLQAPPEGRSVQLAWQAGPGAAPADYVLERADAAAGPFVAIATPTATTYRDAPLVDGRSYHYRVAARDVGGNRGAPSEVRGIVPRDATAPSPPRLNLPLLPGVAFRTTDPRTGVCGSAEADARIELRSDRGQTVQAQAAAGWNARPLANGVQASLGVAVAQDGRWLFVSEFGRGGEVVDLDTGQLIARWPGSARLATASADGRTIWYTDFQTPAIRSLDARTLEASVASEAFDEVQQLLAGPDGRHLLVAGRLTGDADAAAWLLDLQGGAPRRLGDVPDYGLDDRFQWSPDGTRLLFLDLDGDGVVWGTDGSRQETPLGATALAAHWLPDGARLLVLQATASGAQLREVELGSGTAVDRVAFPVSVDAMAVDPSGRFAALRSSQRIDVVDLASGAIVLTEGYAGIAGWTRGHRLVLLRDEVRIIDPPGAFCVREFPLEAGAQDIRASARDAMGNQGGPSAPISVVVAADDLPDLAITASGLRTVPASGRIGDAFSALVTVRNVGRAAAPAAPVTVRLASPAGTERTLAPQTTGPLAADAARTLEFPLGTLDAAGSWLLRAAVDGGNAIVEADESNNAAQRSIAVSASGAPVLELALRTDLLAPGEALDASLAVTNPGAAFDGNLRAEIVDADGDVVAEVLALPIRELGFGERRAFPIAWPTIGRAGGAYRLRAILGDALGAVASTIDAPFAIDAWRVVVLDIAAPAGPVVRGDPLPVRARIAFREGNAELRDARLAFEAIASDGATLRAETRALGTLRPGFEAIVPFNVPTLAGAPGPLRIEARLSSGSFEATAERSAILVDAAAPPALSGALELEPEGDVQLGRDALLRWTVRNAGPVELPNVDARLRLLAAGGATALERTAAGSIAAGSALAGSEDLAAMTLALGSYRALLEARLPGDAAGSWRLLASRTLPVTDGEPPSIAAIEPDGTRPVAPPTALRARVVDRHAGIDRVEAQVDGGVWSPMFGDVDGRFMREAALAEGPHVFRLRATDRHGNATETAARAFVVDGTPPAISIGGVTDGQVGSQDVVPTIAITDAHPDPAQDLRRLDGQPYVAGSPVSAEGAHVLLVGAVDRAGNRSQRTIRFTIDRTPPPLQFVAPIDGTVTATGSVDVRLSSEPGARVALQVGTFAAEAIASASGEALFVAVPLQLGSNLLRARATDAASNQGPERSITVVRNETGSGSLVGSIQVASAVDRGADLAVAVQVRNDTGTVLLQQRFRLRVFGPGGAPLLETRESIRDLAIDATLSEAYALPTGAWPLGQATLMLDAQVGGTWQQLDAAVVDVADGVPPLLAVLAPAVDAVLRNPVRVEAIASDPAGPPPTVRARIDLGPWLDLVRDPGDASRFSRELPPMAEGTHRLDVEARDASGNTTQATPRTFAIDETPPVVAFGGIVDGAVSNAVSVVPTVSVGDAHPGTLEATLDGQPWTSGTPVADEGAHRIDATAVDRAGNRTSAILRFTLDRTAPLVAFSAPPDGTVVAIDRVTVTGTTEGLATVRVSSGAYSALLAADAAGLFVAPDVPLSVGENPITAEATDRAGNTGPVATRVVRHLPNAGATLEATLAVAPAEGEPGAAPLASWSLRNPGPNAVSGLPVRLSFQRIGATLPEVVSNFDVALSPGASAPGSAPLTTTGRPLGAYEAVLEARYTAGDGSLAWTRIADAPYAVVDRTPPSVVFVRPAASSVHGSSIDVEIEASDSASAIDRVEARLAGGPWILLAARDGATDRFGGTLAALADGATALEARATDAAGQIGFASPRPVTIDRVPPQITITGVPPEDPPVNVAVLPGIAAQDASTVELAITLDGQPYTQGTPIVADGPHLLRVVATDAAGNTAEAEARFVIDRTPPVVLLTQPPPGTQTPQATILVAGTTEPGARVRITVGATQRDVLADPKGSFAAADVPLALGSNTIVAAARDRAGNDGMPASVVVLRTGAPVPVFEGRIDLVAKTWQAGDPLPVPTTLRNASAIAATAARFRVLVQTLDGELPVTSAMATLDAGPGTSVQRQFDFATTAWPQAELRLLLQHDRGNAGQPDWTTLDDHLLALTGQCFQAQLFADGFEPGGTSRLFGDGFESCSGVALPPRPALAAPPAEAHGTPQAMPTGTPAPMPLPVPKAPTTVVQAGPRTPAPRVDRGPAWMTALVPRTPAQPENRA
jgi:subtilase family serine protease/flagellar hook assembly protein FlgD/chitodextrinase